MFSITAKHAHLLKSGMKRLSNQSDKHRTLPWAPR